VKCKYLAILHLLDNGERDDKLIAAAEGSPMYSCKDMEDLEKNFSGALEIIEQWFTNYKGPGQIKSSGYENKAAAEKALKQSLDDYSNRRITNETTDKEMLNF